MGRKLQTKVLGKGYGVTPCSAGCGCPVDTSAKQKHRPSRQARRCPKDRGYGSLLAEHFVSKGFPSNNPTKLSLIASFQTAVDLAFSVTFCSVSAFIVKFFTLTETELHLDA